MSKPTVTYKLRAACIGVAACITSALLLASCAGKPAAGIAGTWKGIYLGCVQGPTGMTLVIRRAAGEKVTATFSFRAVPSNPAVPSGEYTEAGTYAGGRLVLHPVKWVHQPGGYIQEGLSASMAPDHDHITGTVTHCRSFSAVRS